MAILQWGEKNGGRKRVRSDPIKRSVIVILFFFTLGRSLAEGWERGGGWTKLLHFTDATRDADKCTRKKGLGEYGIPDTRIWF